MKAISLFSGCGGDSLGMKQAGLEIVAYSEKIKKFQETHHINFPNSILLGKDVKGDITKTPDAEFLTYKGTIDIVFAGFPCQGYSNAGKKKINDPRNTLFKEFVRATKCIQPEYIIGENVKGLLSRKTNNGTPYIDLIQEEFANIGYRTIYKVLECTKFGVPQKRKRFILLGVKQGSNKELSFPIGNAAATNLKKIVSFSLEGALKIEKDDFDMTTLPPECILTDMNNDDEGSNPHPYLLLKTHSRNTTYKEKTFEKGLLSFSKRISPIHSEIIDIHNPSKTIICTYNHQPRLLVPLRNKKGFWLRCLLPHELQQIQGFPPDYKLVGNKKDKITQIGNAVPPPLIETIVRHLMSI